MAILINMAMPKNCLKCPMYDWAAVYCDALNRWVDDGELETERHKDCPLTEIKPHGRLIIDGKGEITIEDS